MGQPPVITNNHNHPGSNLNQSFVVNPGEKAPDINAIGSAALANRIPTAPVDQADLSPMARARANMLANQVQSAATEVIDTHQVVVPEFKKPWE